MQLEQIRTFFEASPAIRLLQSDNAPFVLDFLNLTFKNNGVLAIGHDDLRTQLLIYIEHLHESLPDALKGTADNYLIIWSDSGWLNRHLEAANERQYQLTRHAEDAIQFVELLISRRTGLVGTESRLRLIIDTLSDLVRGSSSDPQKRLAYLEEQKDSIQREIDAISLGGPVDVYGPSKIRDQFQLAVGLLKTLQSDFRAVEERFFDIAMRVQQDQQAALDSRGQILGNAMDSEDLLKTEDEGISFYAFIAFLFSPDGQKTLRETIDEVVRLEAIQDQRDSIYRLRTMVKSLLREADKVLKTNGRLSTSLRKLLNLEAAEDRRQTAEVLRDIKQLACSLRDEPTGQNVNGVTVQTTLGVMSPFTRTFWTTPQSFDNRPSDHVVDLERTAQQRECLENLEFLDLELLRDNLKSVLVSHDQVTLDTMVELFPPESGVMELVGYFQIAFEDGHSIKRDLQTEVIVQDAETSAATRVRIPQVTFHPRDGHPDALYDRTLRKPR